MPCLHPFLPHEKHASFPTSHPVPIRRLLEQNGMSLFYMTQGSGRFFSPGNLSHNTPTYNGRLHEAEGAARILTSEYGTTILDMAPPLGLPAGASQRKCGFIPTQNGKQMTLDLYSPQSKSTAENSADPAPADHDRPNLGMTRIAPDAKAGQSGSIRIEAIFRTHL